MTSGHESQKQRLDRELIELLNELRVALPGVQVLFAFLLAVPFAQRFGDVTSFQRDVYFAALVLSLAMVSVTVLISDVLFDRAATIVVGVLCAIGFVLLWIVLPLSRWVRHEGAEL